MVIGTTTGSLFSDPDFVVRYYKTDTQNMARFIPKSQTLLRYIKMVDLYFPEDKSTVSRVELHETSGDRTLLNFRNTVINGTLAPNAFAE